MIAFRQIEVEGRRLTYAYERSEAEERDARRPAVVCVHGISRNRHDFAFLAGRLSDRFTVLAPDLLGHGDSEWLPAGMIYEKEIFLAQLADLCAGLRGRRIAFVGSSYGGLMGIRLAARGDSPISCLVLNDAGVGIRKEFYEKTAQKLAMYPLFGSMRSVEGWMKLVMANAGALPAEQLAALVEHAVRPTGSGEYRLAYDREIPRVWLGDHGRSPEPWSLWESVRCPVLVVRGARSDVLTDEVVRGMKARKPSMELVEIDGAGHFPHLMDAAQTEPIERWLSANSQEGRP